jgi:hypothetical protein
VVSSAWKAWLLEITVGPHFYSHHLFMHVLHSPTMTCPHWHMQHLTCRPAIPWGHFQSLERGSEHELSPLVRSSHPPSCGPNLDTCNSQFSWFCSLFAPAPKLKPRGAVTAPHHHLWVIVVLRDDFWKSLELSSLHLHASSPLFLVPASYTLGDGWNIFNLCLRVSIPLLQWN